MDIDRRATRLDAVVGSDPPLDWIAHGITFGQGPVWDRRHKRFFFTDIIGDTIWQWVPLVGSEVVVHPSRRDGARPVAALFLTCLRPTRPTRSPDSSRQTPKNGSA